MTQILGRPTGRSITVSVLSPDELEAYFEYGVKPVSYSAKTSAGNTRRESRSRCCSMG